MHCVVDDDAAFAINTGFLRELDVSANTHGHDNEIGIQLGAVGKSNTLHATITPDLGRLGFGAESETALFKGFA